MAIEKDHLSHEDEVALGKLLRLRRQADREADKRAADWVTGGWAQGHSTWQQLERVGQEASDSSPVLPDKIYHGAHERDLNAVFVGLVVTGIAILVAGSAATPVPWVLGAIAGTLERIRSGHAQNARNEAVARDIIDASQISVPPPPLGPPSSRR